MSPSFQLQHVPLSRYTVHTLTLHKFYPLFFCAGANSVHLLPPPPPTILPVFPNDLISVETVCIVPMKFVSCTHVNIRISTGMPYRAQPWSTTYLCFDVFIVHVYTFVKQVTLYRSSIDRCSLIRTLRVIPHGCYLVSPGTTVTTTSQHSHTLTLSSHPSQRGCVSSGHPIFIHSMHSFRHDHPMLLSKFLHGVTPGSCVGTQQYGLLFKVWKKHDCLSFWFFFKEEEIMK